MLFQQGTAMTTITKCQGNNYSQYIKVNDRNVDKNSFSSNIKEVSNKSIEFSIKGQCLQFDKVKIAKELLKQVSENKIDEKEWIADERSQTIVSTINKKIDITCLKYVADHKLNNLKLKESERKELIEKIRVACDFKDAFISYGFTQSGIEQSIFGMKNNSNRLLEYINKCDFDNENDKINNELGIKRVTSQYIFNCIYQENKLSPIYNLKPDQYIVNFKKLAEQTEKITRGYLDDKYNKNGSLEYNMFRINKRANLIDKTNRNNRINKINLVFKQSNELAQRLKETKQS